jgi:hypothetical protein
VHCGTYFTLECAISWLCYEIYLSASANYHIDPAMPLSLPRTKSLRSTYSRESVRGRDWEGGNKESSGARVPRGESREAKEGTPGPEGERGVISTCMGTRNVRGSEPNSLTRCMNQESRSTFSTTLVTIVLNSILSSIHEAHSCLQHHPDADSAVKGPCCEPFDDVYTLARTKTAAVNLQRPKRLALCENNTPTTLH